MLVNPSGLHMTTSMRSSPLKDVVRAGARAAGIMSLRRRISWRELRIGSRGLWRSRVGTLFFSCLLVVVVFTLLPPPPRSACFFFFRQHLFLEQYIATTDTVFNISRINTLHAYFFLLFLILTSLHASPSHLIPALRRRTYTKSLYITLTWLFLVNCDSHSDFFWERGVYQVPAYKFNDEPCATEIWIPLNQHVLLTTFSARISVRWVSPNNVRCFNGHIHIASRSK
jgi:hypothetical protein